MRSYCGSSVGRILLRCLLFLFLFVTVKYLVFYILEAPLLRPYLYAAEYNKMQRHFKFNDKPELAELRVFSDKKHNLKTNNANVKSNITKTYIDVMTEKDTYKTKTNIEFETMKLKKANLKANLRAISRIEDDLKLLMLPNLTTRILKSQQLPMEFCEANPSVLGPELVNKTEVELEDVENKFFDVDWGGRYSPYDCTSKHKVAIIVPYRNRQKHLAIFLNHMHPFLMKQKIEYGIFVIEQFGNDAFNRAKLMNVGFMESQRLKAGGWQCFIFHDIDLLPMDSRNLYTCPRQPRHMSVSIDYLRFRLPYNEIFGGVSALTLEQFTKVNGFSNKYWGWGGEDDDMFYRLKLAGYVVKRYKNSIARYTSLPHSKSKPNPTRYKLLWKIKRHNIQDDDGLSTLIYEVVSLKEHRLYTHILVDIGKPRKFQNISPVKDSPVAHHTHEDLLKKSVTS